MVVRYAATKFLHRSPRPGSLVEYSLGAQEEVMGLLTSIERFLMLPPIPSCSFSRLYPFGDEVREIEERAATVRGKVAFKAGCGRVDEVSKMHRYRDGEVVVVHR